MPAVLALSIASACGESSSKKHPDESPEAGAGATGASAAGAGAAMVGSGGADPSESGAVGGASGLGGLDQGSGAGDASVPPVDAGDDDVEEQRPCSITAGDHEQASCMGGACPFVADVLFECPDTEFAEPGLRVAAREDEALLFTTTTSRALAFSASGGEGAMERLPVSMKRMVLNLAQTQAGEVVLSGDNRTGTETGNVAGSIFISRHTSEGWGEEVVPVPPLLSERHHDFEIDASGVIHQWFLAYGDEGPDGFRHAQRNADGTWLIEDTAPAHPESYFPRWTLDRAGARVGFSYEIDAVDGTTQLVATIDGTDTPLGSSYSANAYPAVWPISPAVPMTTTDVPRAAAVVDAGSELRIVWPSTESYYFEEPVPSTNTPYTTCSAPSPPCASECVERNNGRAAFAATQTSDGRAWIVWSETHTDITYSYEEYTQPELPGSMCGAHVERDDTTATLHVLSFDFATRELVERLTLPMQPIPKTDAWTGGAPESRRLDVRAFGDQLAIGVRVAGPDGNAFTAAVRLLQLDTSSF